MPKVTQSIGGILLGFMSLGLNPLPTCNVSFEIIKVDGYIETLASNEASMSEESLCLRATVTFRWVDSNPT